MTLPPFTRALVRQIANTAADGITSSTHLGAPDLMQMMEQHLAYIDVLQQCGLEISLLPADERYPDGHFVEDPAVISRDMVFISRPGAKARQGEETAISDALAHLNRVYLQGDEATLEGGDVLFCADRVLIGLSQRTNEAGASQLKAALQSVQADLRVDFVPIDGVLHLKTGVTELAPNVLLKSPYLKTDYDFSFAEVTVLPEAEAYAADVLPINDQLLIPADFPTVLQLAEQHYDNIFELEMSEFEKMDGGLTCLSLRY